MIDPTYGWMAQVERAHDFASERVIVGRRIAERRWQYLIGFTPTGDAIMADDPEGAVVSGGLLFPRGALRAIADEVKPGPDALNVARLEEALKVERARVDQVLDRMWR